MPLTVEQQVAIANADDSLQRAGLTTWTELLGALEQLNEAADKATVHGDHAANVKLGEAHGRADRCIQWAKRGLV